MAEPTIEDLERSLRQATLTLNECATLLAELGVKDFREDVLRLGEAIVKIIEVQATVYHLRPDLRPEYFGEDWMPPA